MTEFTDRTEKIERSLAIPGVRERVDEVRAGMAHDDAAYAALSPRMRSYYDTPGLFDRIKRDILTHDQTCASLPDLWLGHEGGVSCPSDQESCDDCGVVFYNEGLIGQYPPGWKSGDPVLQTVDPDDEEEYEAVLCECCGRRRISTERERS